MKNLLIDIGNSNIKTAFGSLSRNAVTEIRKRSNDKKNFKKEFTELIKCSISISGFNNIGVSSLDKSNNKFIKNTINKLFNIDPIFISADLNLPIKINYANTLGSDRICSAVAADNIYPGKNILVIDFGTATTYTLVANKILVGGIISPGILTALNSLKEKTSLNFTLPKFPDQLISNTTEGNIKSGVMLQTQYFCERVINEVKKDYHGLKMIATGGFSELFNLRLKLIDITEGDLVFKGINLILKYNEDINK